MATPVFDASTLSALTQKIQSDFKSGADPRKNRKSSGKKSSEAPAPDSKGRDTVENGKKRKRDTRDGVNSHAPPSEFKPSKDLRNKSAIISMKITHSPKKKSKIDTARANTQIGTPNTGAKKKASEEFDLRQVVSELGGDDEDLQLIEDAGSDSELEGQHDYAQSASLKKELQDMIKALGIPQARVANDEGSSEEEADDDNGEDGKRNDGPDFEQDEEDGESDLDFDNEPQLISQVKQALEKLPERKKPNRHGLEIEPQSEWHTIPVPGISVSDRSGSQIAPETIQQLYEYAEQILMEENDKYATANKTSSSANQFYSTIMSAGTLSDKISALTLSVQESPVHNVRPLENLVNLAKKRNRSQAIEVLSALRDLMGPGNLLPSDRRLRYFTAQPALKFVSGKEAKHWQPGKALPQPLTKTHLIIWAFEDWLKKTYFEILKILEVWLNDEIAYARSKAVDSVFGLLRDKPEQEANLLRLLINKLGDKDKQIASKTSYQILQIENAHPAMKPMIISSIQSDLIFRLHQSNHAKYYGIITLNQTVLSAKEESVARQILSIYFALFMELLKKPKDTEQDAAPKIVPTVNSKGERQGGGSAPGKKAQKKAAAQARAVEAEDELREKMLSAVLTGVNRAMPYIDKGSDFFDKHVDTLFRVTHSANFNTSIQALILIQQFCGSHQAISNRFYRTLYESLLDPRLLTSSKHALYLNLLYRALRADLSVKRVKAFIKRLLQVTAMQQPSFACAAIYLVRELEGVFPSLPSFIDQPEADESDDEEVFRDVPDEDDEVSGSGIPMAAEVTSEEKRGKAYDGRKRDPEHSFAELSCPWELVPLGKHFHPSVSLFAASLSIHDKMPSKPDLNANTLIHFLDRFVYRNPKKTTSGLRGHSLMQPLAGSGDASAMLVSSKDKRINKLAPVNTEGFRNKKENDIEADEVFFHRYFNEISKKPSKQKKDKKDKEDDESEEENEDEIWQALVDSRPEIEGEEDEGDGWDDMDDFEEAMEDADSADSGDDGADLEEDQAALEDDEEDDSGFDFDDEEDLLDSDDELPDGILPIDGKDEESSGDEKEPKTKGKKKSDRRKMLKSLPMFASAEDYAAMLEGEDEG